MLRGGESTGGLVLAFVDTPGGTVDEYEFAARSSGVVHDPADGILLHIAAPYEGGIFTATIWRNRLLADLYFATVLSKALTDLAAAPIGGPSRVPDLTYTILSIEELVVGESAANAGSLQLGDASEHVMYSRTVPTAEIENEQWVTASDLVPTPAPALIAHIRAADEDQTIRMDLWESASAVQYGEDPPINVLRAHLHTIVIQPELF